MTEPDQVVASFTDYAGAQRAVDALADRRFPVEHLLPAGCGRGPGERGDPPVSAIVLGLWALAIGALIGASVGLVRHAMTGGRRDFSSASTFRAERYNLVADADFAVQARRTLLGRLIGKTLRMQRHVCVGGTGAVSGAGRR